MFDPSFAPDPDAVARIRVAADGRAPAWAAGPGCEDMVGVVAGGRASSTSQPAALAGAVAALSNIFAALAGVRLAGRAPVRGRVRIAGRPPVRSFGAPRRDQRRDGGARRGRRGYCTGTGGPAKLDDTTECLAVPRAAVGRVIGKRGATIKGIERDSGCRVRVVDGDDDGDDAEVRVSHPDEARRAAALDAVLAIVERDQYRPPPSRGTRRPGRRT